MRQQGFQGRKRIWVIAQYFHPDFSGSVTRTANAVKCLIRKKYDILLITAVPHYPDGSKTAFSQKQFFRHYHAPGLDMIKVWMPPISHKNKVGRMINYFYFMFAAIIVGILHRKVDFIFASSPNFFTNLTGIFIKFVKQKPLITNVNDLVPEALIDLNYFKPSRLMKLLVGIRNLTLNLSDKVVCISETIANYLQSLGINKSKIETIEVGIDTDRFLIKNLRPLNNESNNSNLHIVYSGNLGSAYDFDVLFKIAEKAIKMGRTYRFTIRGKGDQELKLKQMLRNGRYQNVALVTEKLGNQEYINFMNSADVFILPMKDNLISTTALPSKLFDYLILRKPVIVIGRGEPAKLVNKSHAGIAISHSDLDDAIPFLELIEKNPNIRTKMGNDGANYVINTYSLEVIAEKLENVIHTLSI